MIYIVQGDTVHGVPILLETDIRDGVLKFGDINIVQINNWCLVPIREQGIVQRSWTFFTSVLGSARDLRKVHPKVNMFDALQGKKVKRFRACLKNFITRKVQSVREGPKNLATTLMKAIPASTVHQLRTCIVRSVSSSQVAMHWLHKLHSQKRIKSILKCCLCRQV